MSTGPSMLLHSQEHRATTTSTRTHESAVVASVPSLPSIPCHSLPGIWLYGTSGKSGMSLSFKSYFIQTSMQYPTSIVSLVRVYSRRSSAAVDAGHVDDHPQKCDDDLSVSTVSDGPRVCTTNSLVAQWATGPGWDAQGALDRHQLHGNESRGAEGMPQRRDLHEGIHHRARECRGAVGTLSLSKVRRTRIGRVRPVEFLGH